MAVDEHGAGVDSRGAVRGPRSRSVVQSAAPRPNSVWLASRTASSASLTRMTLATGPNVSSVNATPSGVTWSRIVGG